MDVFLYNVSVREAREGGGGREGESVQMLECSKAFWLLVPVGHYCINLVFN